ncbi:hypothetical protein Q3V23_35900 [Streptomyces sp. VNUA116]|uniref:hypothetical protein n=1 Tax=Streptomyces sp. VNUA116 TaxID=3062449 RepID=UPI002675FA8D|nr:hypothetical protein [Streptomyces sp. VNUA116]WKU49021.1 hypothetical protein Q3V23_35900 [Streptomyces sp. VNUA116]
MLALGIRALPDARPDAQSGNGAGRHRLSSPGAAHLLFRFVHRINNRLGPLHAEEAMTAGFLPAFLTPLFIVC